MDQLTDDEKFLLLGKVTGTLSPAEEEMLTQLFLTNPHARPAYEALTASLPASDVETQFARRQTHSTWRDLRAELRQQQQTPAAVIPFYRRKWQVAAAIIAGLLVTAGVVFWQQSGKREKSYLAATSAKAGIELKLANGRVIDLSREQGTINAGSAQLTNSHKSLSFAPGKAAEAEALNTLTVPTGLDYKLNLPDGTEIWLNSATQISFPLAFTGSSRQVTINGEAYLKIAPDPAKPFFVQLPHSTVQVLGTAFNVNTYDSGVVKVALVEGAVNLQAPTGKSRLTPGRQAIYREGHDITQETFDARRVLSWRNGLFYFEDASLEEICKVVPRWYGIQVTVDNPAIRSRTFSGVINRNQPVTVFMEDLKAISGIESYKDQRGVLHFK